MRLLKYFILFFIPSIILYSQIVPLEVSMRYSLPLNLGDIYLVNTVNDFPAENDLAYEKLEVVDIKDLRNTSLEQKKQTLWLYQPVEVMDSLSTNVVLNLILANIGDVFEVYWDNKLVGKRGHILKPSDKWNKGYFHQVTIPFDYTNIGMHSILVKVYYDWNYHNNNYSYMQLGFNLFYTGLVEKNYPTIITYTVLFVSALFFFVLFFGVKKYEYLYFAIFCIAFALRAYFRPAWLAEDFGVAESDGNDVLSAIMLPVAFFSLHLYMLIKLAIFQKYKYQSIAIILTVVSVLFLSEYNYIRLALIIAGLIACFGIYKKNYSSIFILTGLIGFWLLSRGTYNPIAKGHVDYPGLLFLIVIIVILSSMEIARNNKRHRESVLKASRLENELLKRNIQPHFILNTLTALQEVIVKSPEMASSLIEALADEFRLFSKVSGEKLISISDELNICDAHLRIMEYRKGAKFTLTTEGINGDETIPPGIFHTLVENGTTHGYSELRAGNFHLKKTVSKESTIYRLFNNGKSEDENTTIIKGTGFRYIEARLEESFPGKWKLNYGPIPDGWEVVIEINSKNGK